MDRLSGKVCLVTGAARGIGLAVAKRFVAEGAKVLIADIDAAEGQATADALGDHAAFCTLDVTDAGQWTAAFDQLANLWGAPDIVVNNAGVAVVADVEALTPEQWNTTLDVNLTAVMTGTQQAIARMKTAGGGSIVNIASIEGIIGEQIVPAYNASKAGVRLYSKSAAIHCARSGYNIRVNCVCPGFVETAMVENGLAALGPEGAEQFQAGLTQRVPMGRLGTADEIANAVLFVASDEASFITGSDLVVDGGHTAA